MFSFAKLATLSTHLEFLYIYIYIYIYIFFFSHGLYTGKWNEAFGRKYRKSSSEEIINIMRYS